jgi:hypothetical protein
MTADQDLTLMTPNLEILVLPETSLEMTYKFATADVPTKVINKSDNDLIARETILADGTAQFVLSTELSTTNANISPVISLERSSVLAINNLTFDIGNNEFEAGVYVSRTVVLNTLSDDLRVILDAQLPAGSSVRPYYRTTKFTPKSVTIQDSLTPLDQNQLNKGLAVYWRTSGATLTQKGVASVTQVADNSGADTDRYYLSGVAEYTDFKNSVDFPTESDIGIDGHIIMTSEEGITSMPDWVSGTAYVAGDYVIVGDTLWKCLLNNSQTSSPAASDLNWQQLDMVYAISVVTDGVPTSWRPMRQSTETSPEVNVATRYIEYEFEPAEYVDEEFDDFAIKLELISTDAINIPLVRNLRAIAVM